LTQTVDASNKTKNYTYDNNNNNVTIGDANGITTNTFNQDNRLTKIVTPDNKVTEFGYNSTGAQTATKDAALNTTNYGYDQYNNLITKQDALNRTTQYQYDLMNRNKQSTTPLAKVAKWEYDPNGNLTKRIDESNRATVYEYDNLNRLIKTTYPDASIVTNTYDSRGNLLQVSTPTGTSVFTYDTYNRLVSEAMSGGLTTSYTYDSAGNITSVIYPDSKMVQYVYNSKNQLITATDWNNQQTTYTYNANDSLATKQLPNGISASYGYDQTNRVSSLQYTQNQQLITRYNYSRDSSGNITNETETKDAPTQLPTANYSVFSDSLNSAWNTWSSYNATISTSDTPTHQGAAALSYVSNAWGYLDLRPNTGSVSTTPYSALSFAARGAQAGQKVYLSLRDSNNAVLTKIDISHFGGNLSGSGYKLYNIPLGALGATNKSIKSIQFTNDLYTNSQPKVYIDNLKFTTDQANAAVMYDDELTGAFTSYPWSGAAADLSDTTAPYNGSKAIGLTLSMYGGLTLYDYRGIDTAGYQNLTFAIRGSQANQALSIQASNSSGVEIGPELPLVNYGGNPTSGSYKSYSIPVSSLVPTNGRIYGVIIKNKTNVAQPKIFIDDIKLALPDANGTQRVATFGYDALNRLTSANSPDGRFYTYSYDAVGNRLNSNDNGTSTTQVYNNDNQLTSKGSRSFTYDNQGNQITDSTKSLTYDYDSKLKQWSNPSTSTTFNFSYDGLGNRIGKAGGGTTRQYVNSTVDKNSKVLIDKNVTASTNTYYLYGDSLVSQGGAAPTSRQYFLTDAMGNVRYVTDSAGAQVQSYNYDPYGNEVTPSTTSNYAFQGYEKDRETNLTYLRARYYDPTIGRFISKDPVPGVMNVPESQNGYSYAHNDPINLTDPSGEIVDTIWDLGNVAYDLATCSYGDLAVDGAAAFIPFLPAGSSKLVRGGAAAADAANSANFAKKVGLGADSLVVMNRSMKVTDYISKYRKGSVRSEMPSQYLNMTVEQALLDKNSTVRKLLVDGRFAK